MAKTLGIVLAVVALLALFAACALLAHGLLARRQMRRGQRRATVNAASRR